MKPTYNFVTNQTISTIKCDAGSIILQGCYSSVGTGKQVRVDGKMDQQQDRAILEENLLKAAKDVRLMWRFAF